LAALLRLNTSNEGKMNHEQKTIGKTIWQRTILGMNQKEYAQKVADISPRILSEFENGSGNPTLATLKKIASPFGLKVTFLPPESWRIHAQNE